MRLNNTFQNEIVPALEAMLQSDLFCMWENKKIMLKTMNNMLWISLKRTK